MISEEKPVHPDYALVQAALQGDERALEKLAELTRPLREMVARKICRNNEDKFQLAVQFGWDGVVGAMAAYRGDIAFCGFAYPGVAWRIKHELAYEDETIYRPVNHRRDLYNLNKLSAETGLAPSDPTLARRLGISAVRQANALDTSLTVTSLNAPASPHADTSVELVEFIPAEAHDVDFWKTDRAHFLREAMQKDLTAREREIITLYFLQKEDASTEEIGFQVGLSKTQAGTIIRAVLEKLRRSILKAEAAMSAAPGLGAAANRLEFLLRKGYHPFAMKCMPQGVTYDRKTKLWKPTFQFGKVKEAFRRIDSGMDNVAAIAHDLKIRPKALREILRNRTFVGERHYRLHLGDQAPKQFSVKVMDPLIAPDQFDRVQRILDEAPNKGKVLPETKPVHNVIKAVVRCGRCGAKLYFSAQTGLGPRSIGGYYFCSSKMPKLTRVPFCGVKPQTKRQLDAVAALFTETVLSSPLVAQARVERQVRSCGRESIIDSAVPEKLATKPDPLTQGLAQQKLIHSIFTELRFRDGAVTAFKFHSSLFVAEGWNQQVQLPLGLEDATGCVHLKTPFKPVQEVDLRFREANLSSVT